MRRPVLTLAAALAAGSAVAQTPPVSPVQPARTDVLPTPGSGNPVGVQPGGLPAGLPVGQSPAAIDPALKVHLDAWEKSIAGITNFFTSTNLTKKNAILKKETQYTGSIICLKPNMARMRIEKKDKKDEYTAYICTGTAVYEYDGTGKQVTEYKLPNGGVGDNLLLSFVSGALKANDVISRFDVKLMKEDANYVYLEIKPRGAADKADFESMIVVLYGPKVPTVAYLPRTVVMRKNNGQEEEVWEFLQPVLNHQGIKPDDFKYVPPPKDWKFQQAQTQPPPGNPGPAPKDPKVARP
jgi:TIGR03009 family protein